MINTSRSNVAGIVAEYNPFHNGHLYHLQKSKKCSNAPYAVVVMSGDYVQRGMPAVFDKYLRTAMALDAGADLVLELPCPFATGSAEDFASGSIALLDKLGIVDTVCFGSECGNTDQLLHTASILVEEPLSYQNSLKAALKTGMTFPMARMEALAAADTDSVSGSQKSYLASPNNILGIEYCKALIRRNSAMIPVTFVREGSSYHDQTIGQSFCSASAIRQELFSHSREEIKASAFLELLQQQIPEQVFPWFTKGQSIYSDDFSTLLHAALLRLALEQTPLSIFADVSEELASRISGSLYLFSPFEEKIKQLKTKQYTYTRISRALLHILLGITKDQMAAYRTLDYVPYARVLGFRKSSSLLLTEIKKRGRIPLITKTADAAAFLQGTAKDLFLQDLTCSHLYQSVAEGKYHNPLKNEYTRSVVIR